MFINNWLVASFIGFILMLSGCSKESIMNMSLDKSIEYEELGQCIDSEGTLSRVKYSGSNILGLFSKISYFGNSNNWNYCIPDLDRKRVNSLSVRDKERLDAGFFNAIGKIYKKEMVKSKSGEVKQVSISLQDMQTLVEMGSELAYLDMHLFDYHQTFTQFNFTEDNPYYQRLKQMANGGDAEASCLFSRRIPSPFKGYEHLKYDKERDTKDQSYFNSLLKERFLFGPEGKWTRGSIDAAKRGASDCMAAHGHRLLKGNPNLQVRPDQTLGKEYLVQAAQKGSARASAVLYLNYKTGISFQRDLGKYVCWAKIYNDSFPPVYKKEDFESYIKIQRLISKDLVITHYSTESLCQKELESPLIQ